MNIRSYARFLCLAILYMALFITAGFGQLSGNSGSSKGSIAKADLITLVCKNKNQRVDLIPHITVDLNEADGRVTVYYPATSIPYPGTVLETPAITAGPLPATFDSKTVAFDVGDRYNQGFYQRYTLDRLTGVLLDFASVNGPYDQAPPSDRGIRTYKCKVGKAKF